MNYKTPNRFKNLGDSMIRRMTSEAIKHKAINMGQGFPEFDPHPSILTAAKNALSIGHQNQYSEDRGSQELREAISKKCRRFYNWEASPDDEVTVVCGVTEAIVVAILATVETNDKVVIIEPAHENYFAAVVFAGGTPVWVPLEPPNFELNLNRIEDEFKNGAKFIILNTPHNPTGRVFTEDEMKKLSELCVRYNVIVITDEIYEHIIYDKKPHHPLALFPGMSERTITTTGLGKTYSLTGWRIGYIVAPKDITRAIRKVHTFISICAPTPLQAASIEALNLPDSYYEDLISKYTASRSRMMEILKDAGFKAKTPEGAYYVMADFGALSDDDDVKFSFDLVQNAKVAVIPGSSFYNNKAIGRKLVRFAFPKPIGVLEETASRLKKYFK